MSTTTAVKAPFRADHVGSLLRPPALIAARKQRAAGTITPEQLRAAEDDAIRDAVAMQKSLGLKSATDGEYRRAFWNMDFLWAMNGIDREDDNPVNIQFKNEGGNISFAAPAARVVGPVSLPETIFGEHFTFLNGVVDDDVTAKITIPSPSTIFRGARKLVPESVYPDLDKFWHDIEAAYAKEVQGLYDLGCRYLQLDDTALAFLTDETHREELAKAGGDPEHQHEVYIEAINRVLAGRPDDLAVTIHICRGNHASGWQASGGYDPIAEALFGQLEVDGYFLEYDSDRAGTFAPLRFVPEGKQVVLGLITSKTPQLEDKDELKRRIDEAAQLVPLEQLCLSPQCGFASTEGGNKLSYDEQRAKLQLVVETADEVWG